MSWMDSWSRPSKSQPVPAPYYLLPGGENTTYCKSCGRVISERKLHATKETTTPAKYCSRRCRSHKPSKLDQQIEDAFVGFLEGTVPLPAPQQAGHTTHKEQRGKKMKGDSRIVIPCDVVEEFVFGPRHDPEKDWGRKKNKARRCVQDDGEWLSVDMVPKKDSASDDSSAAVEDKNAGEMDGIDGQTIAQLSIRSGTRIRPAQQVSEVNGSVGGEKGLAERVQETEEMLEKRRQGDKRAEERERVRSAARRGVAFGFDVLDHDNEQIGERRKCEAVMQGKVVEPSLAKGDWGIRWRE
ncbi:hypothetical protein GQ43DRAFT_365316 [Delitschia confertaspora ATCC 74209]|uniref:Uncharacterized protein n=1 Tax=Delitschia confertaspora ATCC 74209 TaxID=1513339 RepID=A0A9P4JR04_9PLEO|nr:hypothetical protein GQ43DRAFT_365316 [Delitschia confertaspora ATCC 74209]